MFCRFGCVSKKVSACWFFAWAATSSSSNQGFLVGFQKGHSGLQGTCSCDWFRGRSVLQGHGVLLFRNRPLGLRCGAVLRHLRHEIRWCFVVLAVFRKRCLPVGFLLEQPPAAAAIKDFFQKGHSGLQGTCSCDWFRGRSVLQGHGVLLFRNRPLGLRCGAVLRAWELAAAVKIGWWIGFDF